MSENFWTEEPCALFDELSFIPTKSMSRAEKLNALTRLILIVALIMYFMKYKQWLTFLVIGVVVIIVLNYTQKEGFKKNTLSKEKEHVSEVTHSDDDTVENFTIVPTYTGGDFQQTVVTPTFAEEWQIPPPAYDLYTQVPYPDARDTFEAPLTPQSYPYGQYLTRTNLLPSDEYYTHLGCGGARTAREFVNSTFLRHDLARRENMMRIYKKRLNRRYRSNTQDSFSPYSSY